MMKKYIYSIKMNFLSGFQYRLNTVSSIFLWNISLFATFIFWIVALKIKPKLIIMH